MPRTRPGPGFPQRHHCELLLGSMRWYRPRTVLMPYFRTLGDIQYKFHPGSTSTTSILSAPWIPALTRPGHKMRRLRTADDVSSISCSSLSRVFWVFGMAFHSTSFFLSSCSLSSCDDWLHLLRCWGLNGLRRLHDTRLSNSFRCFSGTIGRTSIFRVDTINIPRQESRYSFLC